MLEHVVDDANYEAKNKSCNVVLSANIKPVIVANAELLHRSFENIVRNAINYTDQSSQVSIKLEISKLHPDSIHICICDDGEGVAEESIEKLFDPFFRVAQSRDRSSGGYGLGLAIASRAILLHGGSIKARNKKTKGLCISIELPINIERDNVRL
ncbi:MAG: ATP-binding protein [Gammaproteobacteria bacterium]|nr:ATP-binding protein [Gammaproteobacteria bacterium]